jgi:hypothetical protein
LKRINIRFQILNPYSPNGYLKFKASPQNFSGLLRAPKDRRYSIQPMTYQQIFTELKLSPYIS